MATKSKAKTKPKRRMGADDAETRAVLMDAAEGLMREQGYAALSARKLAARAGLKYQIVFYYFETMDDLLAATYRRNSERTLQSVREALASERPLHALWAVWSHPFDGALTVEFMAAANHSPVLRAEWLAFTNRLVQTLSQTIAEWPQDATAFKAFSPLGFISVLASVGSTISFANALGQVRSNNTNDFIEHMLERVEPSATGSVTKP